MHSSVLLICYLSLLSFVFLKKSVGQSLRTSLTSRSDKGYSQIDKRDHQSDHNLLRRNKHDGLSRRKHWENHDTFSWVKCPNDQGGQFVLIKKHCYLAAYHLAVNGLSYSECGSCAVAVTDKDKALKKVSLTCSEAQAGVDYIFKLKCYNKSNVPFPKFSSHEEFSLTTQASKHHTSCQDLIRHDQGTQKSQCIYHQ